MSVETRCDSYPDLLPMTDSQPVPAKTLLADLESRQEELLRLLGDLEERTKQALAQLAAAPPAPAKDVAPRAKPTTKAA